MNDYSYDNSRDLLRFIMDVATTNSKADYNDDKVWKKEFQFIVTEIDEFLNELKKKTDHHKSELPVPVNCCNCKKVFKENEHSWCDDGVHTCDNCVEIAQDDLAECCHNAELEFSRVGSCFGYNIYACSECGASYDVEIIPDFSTKQKLN